MISGMYDLIGLIILLTAGMKSDIHSLVQRKLKLGQLNTGCPYSNLGNTFSKEARN